MHQNQNSLLFLNHYKKSLVENQKINCENLPQINQFSNQNLLKINISISGLNRQIQKTQYFNKNDRQIDFKNKKITFPQLVMMNQEESHFSFSANIQINDSQKENHMSLMNREQVDFYTFEEKIQESKVKKVKQLQKMLQKTYSKGLKNFNIFSGQSQFQQQPLGDNRRLKVINKLISMLETNKNIRVRTLFEQRQVLSEQRQIEKRQCVKKLQKIKEINEKVQNGEISHCQAECKMGNLQEQQL